MSRRPIPPHGSEARYQGCKTRPPCRCRTCIDGWTRAGQLRLLGNLSGRPAKVPAEPITAHLRHLAAAGMTPQQIATLSGVNVTTVRDHTAGDFLTLRRTTAEKLLAVRPSQQPTDGWVSSLGAIRRCRALYTLGHGAKAIAAAHPDLQLRTVEYIIRGKRQHLTVAVHNTICEAYRKLCRVAGTSSQAKLRAATEGWHGPLAWDDIDNPTAKPETGRKTRAKAGIRKVHADRARVAELTAAGRSAQQIADELGCHKRTVVRARRKTDMGVAA